MEHQLATTLIHGPNFLTLPKNWIQVIQNYWKWNSYAHCPPSSRNFCTKRFAALASLNSDLVDLKNMYFQHVFVCPPQICTHAPTLLGKIVSRSCNLDPRFVACYLFVLFYTSIALPYPFVFSLRQVTRPKTLALAIPCNAGLGLKPTGWPCQGTRAGLRAEPRRSVALVLT